MSISPRIEGSTGPPPPGGSAVGTSTSPASSEPRSGVARWAPSVGSPTDASIEATAEVNEGLGDGAGPRAWGRLFPARSTAHARKAYDRP